MKAVIILAFALISSISFGQKLKFKILNQKDTTVHLIKYWGSKLYYADTAEIKGGYVEFDGSKQKPGILGILLPGQKFFEFIYNNEEVSLETSSPDFVQTMKIKKSEENKIFIEYIKFIGPKKTEADNLSKERTKLNKEDAKFTELSDKIDALNKEVIDYQKNLVNTYKGMLVSKIVKMSMDIEIPETPKDTNGVVLDSNFRFNYFRKHYWDNIDLNVDALVNTPVFHNKLEYFFGKNMMIQHWDTVLYYAYDLCDHLNPKSKTFEYCVSWITSSYGKSNIMGMDKVYIYMADRYYCSKNAEGKSPAFWMTPDKLEELCEKIPVQKNLVMGVKPPNLILRDTTDKVWRDFYSLKSDYTILYFWDPECGHCKKTTPKLETLYKEKFKDRNIEIFSVGKAVGEDFEKWKKFIRDNKMTFINVAVTDPLFKAAMEDARQFVPKYTTIESLNYQTTYDIFSTPRVWVLDKDKKIIAKSISISQLEEMMDRLQGKEDLPKLFPPDPEEDEQMH
ncbi:MAG: thioredoxin-like domain-containing protein [Flavobacteriia bacterium]